VPRVQTAFLAHAAHLEANGLVSTLGSFVELVGARQLPVRMPLWFVARLTIEEGDEGPAVPVAVIVDHDDGERLVRIDGTLNVSGRPQGADTDMPVSFQVVMQVQLEFRRAGLYHVRLKYNGEEVVDQLLKVRQEFPTV